MAVFISLIRTGPLVLNQPPEAVFAPMLLVEAPHEPCVVFDARFRTEMIGKPGTRQQISCRIRVQLRRAPIEDAFQHAAIKSGSRGRIFLLQRLGRGSQRIVGRPVQFRQPLPDEPVGALQVWPGNEESERGLGGSMRSSNCKGLSFRLEILKVGQRFR